MLENSFYKCRNFRSVWKPERIAVNTQKSYLLNNDQCMHSLWSEHFFSLQNISESDTPRGDKHIGIFLTDLYEVQMTLYRIYEENKRRSPIGNQLSHSKFMAKNCQITFTSSL